MSDELSNATRIAALEEQVRDLTHDLSAATLRNELTNNDYDDVCVQVGALRDALTKSREYAERLLAENVRLSNEAAEVRVALDKERERCGVLEREVKAARMWKRWRSCAGGPDQAEVRAYWEECITETDTRHALDAAKFVGGGQ